jgi:hypothetical protein
MKFSTCLQRNSHSSVFMDKFLHLIHSSSFAHQCMSQASAISNRGHILLNLETHSKTCALPTACSPKHTTFEGFCSIFPKFKAKYNIDMLSFKPTVFWVQNNCKWNKHLYLARHYSTTACAITLFQAGNDSADSALSTTTGRSSCYQQYCHLVASPEIIRLHLIWKICGIKITDCTHIEKSKQFPATIL